MLVLARIAGEGFRMSSAAGIHDFYIVEILEDSVLTGVIFPSGRKLGFRLKFDTDYRITVPDGPVDLRVMKQGGRTKFGLTGPKSVDFLRHELLDEAA